MKRAQRQDHGDADWLIQREQLGARYLLREAGIVQLLDLYSDLGEVAGLRVQAAEALARARRRGDVPEVLALEDFLEMLMGRGCQVRGGLARIDAATRAYIAVTRAVRPDPEGRWIGPHEPCPGGYVRFRANPFHGPAQTACDLCGRPGLRSAVEPPEGVRPLRLKVRRWAR